MGIRPHVGGITVDPFPFGLDRAEITACACAGARIDVRIAESASIVTVDGETRESVLGEPLEIPDLASCTSGGGCKCDRLPGSVILSERALCSMFGRTCFSRTHCRRASTSRTTVRRTFTARHRCRPRARAANVRQWQSSDSRRITSRSRSSIRCRSGLYVIDRDYRIPAWNRKRETGHAGRVARRSARPHDLRDPAPPAGRRAARASSTSVFATGESCSFHMESTAHRRAAHLSHLQDPDALDERDVVTHVITVGEDVTEAMRAQRRALRAGEKLAAIGTLAAGVMHEINNPLATIGACAETLACSSPMPPIAGGASRDVRGAVRHHRSRGASLQAHPQRAARLQPSEGAPRARRPNCSDVIEQTLLSLKYHTRFKAHARARSISRPTRGCVVRADREQLMQVLHGAADQRHGRHGPVGDDSTCAHSRSPVRGEEVVIAEVIDDGQRHSARRAPQDLRALLHDQAARARHGARAVDLLRHRRRSRRTHRGRQRARQGQHVSRDPSTRGARDA